MSLYIIKTNLNKALFLLKIKIYYFYAKIESPLIYSIFLLTNSENIVFINI